MKAVVCWPCFCCVCLCVFVCVCVISSYFVFFERPTLNDSFVSMMLTVSSFQTVLFAIYKYLLLKFACKYIVCKLMIEEVNLINIKNL